MKNVTLKVSLFINYFVFAILLNSVGIVIAKSIRVYNVTEGTASVLEGFKDLPIAVVSFLVASFLPRFGYKRAMLLALGIVFFGCLGMYYGNSFTTAKVLFMSIGVSFALIKLSVYTLIGVVTDGPKEHSELMGYIEGFFMVGIASAYFLFPAFYGEDPDAWLNVYPVLCGLILISFLFLFFSKIHIETETAGSNVVEDIKNSVQLIALPLVLVFILSAFFFVMLEQGIMTWLPRFNEKIFAFSDKLSVRMASILAISLAVGRFVAGWLSKKVAWEKIIIISALVAMGILLAVLPKLTPNGNESLVLHSLGDVPFLGFVLPLIGLFIAPIYPILNSTVLSHLPKSLHSPMSGLIIIFSALGGTIGSRIVGELFEHIGGVNAFYFLIIPIVLLIITVLIIKRLIVKEYVPR